ncbi:MAG: hypothetical protein PHU85_02970 [Phycisphaerae bacterium]|nr:hypothetical protein [Phycisphaerae bacterium]
MRNLFDQYEQAENRLTHALMTTLHNDRKLIRPFLGWLLGTKQLPPMKAIRIGQQQAPGTEADTDKEDNEGLPDGCFFDDQDWAVLIESKVQAAASLAQLERHRRLAARYGYPSPSMILLAVDPPPKGLPADTHFRAWREVYDWFCHRGCWSAWVLRFIDYMQVFEAKMLAEDYNIRGTLTMFSGFQFSEENPYTYREGKRLIRLMGQEFRKNKRLLKRLSIDPDGKGRPALTKGDAGTVWDIVPLKVARDHVFTAFPHATMVLRPCEAAAAITIPNAIKGGIKNRLRRTGKDGFASLLAKVGADLRPVVSKVPGSQPMIYIKQRHSKSQRSPAVTDGVIEVDLRTLLATNGSPLKHQPGWLDAIDGVLTAKKTNIQMGIEVHLPYAAPVMQTARALDIMAEAWIALRPLVEFGLAGVVE